MHHDGDVDTKCQGARFGKRRAGENRRLTGRLPTWRVARSASSSVFGRARSPGQRLHLHFLREPVRRTGATPTVPRLGCESTRWSRSRESQSAWSGKERICPLYCVILYFCWANGNMRLPDEYLCPVRIVLTSCKYICFS